MNISRTTARIAALLGTMVVVVAVAASAQASSSKPAAMSKAEYRALMSRSEALNARYGNAVTRLSPQQFKALYAAGGDRLAPQELLALVARSEALNRRYGLGGTTGSTQSSRVLDSQKPVGSAAATFDWGDFGIGAAAMLGVLLLTGGLIAGSRYGRRVPRARVS
jgi:hypothetical protein